MGRGEWRERDVDRTRKWMQQFVTWWCQKWRRRRLFDKSNIFHVKMDNFCKKNHTHIVRSLGLGPGSGISLHNIYLCAVDSSDGSRLSYLSRRGGYWVATVRHTETDYPPIVMMMMVDRRWDRLVGKD